MDEGLIVVQERRAEMDVRNYCEIMMLEVEIGSSSIETHRVSRGLCGRRHINETPEGSYVIVGTGYCFKGRPWKVHSQWRTLICKNMLCEALSALSHFIYAPIIRDT